jgi:hypothetical protein
LAKLPQNVMHVKLHRTVSQSQFSRYFPVGQATSDEPRDLMLTSRQAISIHLRFLISLDLASLRLSELVVEQQTLSKDIVPGSPAECPTPLANKGEYRVTPLFTQLPI